RSDLFERHVAGRRGMVRAPAEGLPMLAAELAACGITTACLAQYWSWEGGQRGPEAAKALAAALADHAGPVDLRIQLRVETHMIADFNAIARFVRAAGIGYLVFNDHLPHKALARGKRPERLTGAALRAGRSPEAHLELIRALAANGPQVPLALARLVAELPPVVLGSHDDADARMREGYAALGAEVAEFPLFAPEAGPVVMGAPNVLRGGSHGRGPDAAAMVRAGRCGVLASDYHYPAMLDAVRRLVAEGMALPEAWDLVSGAPARMLGLADRGHLAEGARGDVVLLDAGTLELHATFAAGQPVWLSPMMAGRLLAAGTGR
uniref:alpha-D-ribose 1-methylphosphonate 5-triphosphate diphosphatase n=1 Tax=Roseobacter sp. HKCCA0434 TaxID=3079297 RepID=UPI0029059DD0